MRNPRVLLLGTALWLAACGSDSKVAEAIVGKHKPRRAPQAQTGPTIAQQTAGMVLASSPPHSPDIADLKFELRGRPEVGSALSVDLALLPKIDADAATLTLTSSEGLSVPADAATINLGEVGQAGLYRKTVSVTPLGEGVVFLNALATLSGSGVTQTRSFTVPIIAAAAAAKR